MCPHGPPRTQVHSRPGPRFPSVLEPAPDPIGPELPQHDVVPFDVNDVV